MLPHTPCPAWYSEWNIRLGSEIPRSEFHGSSFGDLTLSASSTSQNCCQDEMEEARTMWYTFLGPHWREKQGINI